ncbi:NAD-dependent epimerase/dehydratase family protein [Streptomyces sp. KAI-26]|uniref:NAD-dependent epimerase/dehydratase family protein n=1 Tax=Streptomyces sp. KAI-26 TaxID=1169747 RepID=UPI0015872095|nr:NAD-dependent epimerase/dehydratase family protein [Streptomyces sp. KAI-26]NUV87823.1 NAD-dependent epimerase/dehydratase family protein [Streptomyces sp. KAI-26]NUW20245.1 NAD-dependent epimerase/dehydratase family protein [Streptomyces roseoviolaceus]
MRVLLTGASGYVGQAVVHRLVANGVAVTALEYRTRRRWPPAVHVRTGDLLRPAELWEAVRDVDAVCHLAADATVRHTSADAAELQRQVITEGTGYLLAAMGAEAERRGVPMGLLHLSSSAVYGRAVDRPLRVTDAAEPRSSYGAAKLAAEEAIGAAAATGRIGAISLRLFNAGGRTPYGGAPSPATLIHKAVAAVSGRSTVLTVNGDGSALRDFVHVCDVATAVVAGLFRTTPATHHVHNVGATPASVLEVLAEVGRAAGRAVPVRHRAADGMDTPYLVADTADTRAALNWEPVSSGLPRIVTEQFEAFYDEHNSRS